MHADSEAVKVFLSDFVNHETNKSLELRPGKINLMFIVTARMEF